LKPWEAILPIISRVTGRILVGTELCRNPEWIQLTIENTTGIMKSAMGIRAIYPSQWQWLAPWTAPWRNELINLRKKAAKLIEPTYKRRLSSASNEKANDVVQWLINNAEGKPTTSGEIADAVLFLYMAGIQYVRYYLCFLNYSRA
jgi:hypothetical protein